MTSDPALTPLGAHVTALSPELAYVAELIREAGPRGITVLTGAGISTEKGLL